MGPVRNPVCVECLIGKQNKPTLFKVTEPNSVPYRAPPACAKVCVECLIGKQKKPILFKVTEPSSIPYRAPPACAKMAEWRFETRGIVHGGA